MARVMMRLARRVLEMGVGLFALLGFAFVPLGKRTALEHVKAIVSTEPAREAGRELLAAAGKLRTKIFESLPSRDGARPPPEALPDAGPPLEASLDAGPPLEAAPPLVCIAPLVEEAETR